MAKLFALPKSIELGSDELDLISNGNPSKVVETLTQFIGEVPTLTVPPSFLVEQHVLLTRNEGLRLFEQLKPLKNAEFQADWLFQNRGKRLLLIK